MTGYLSYKATLWLYVYGYDWLPVVQCNTVIICLWLWLVNSLTMPHCNHIGMAMTDHLSYKATLWLYMHGYDWMPVLQYHIMTICLCLWLVSRLTMPYYGYMCILITGYLSYKAILWLYMYGYDWLPVLQSRIVTIYVWLWLVTCLTKPHCDYMCMAMTGCLSYNAILWLYVYAYDWLPVLQCHIMAICVYLSLVACLTKPHCDYICMAMTCYLSYKATLWLYMYGYDWLPVLHSHIVITHVWLWEVTKRYLYDI